jgi:small subunit ribosomal protein S2
VPLLNKAAKVVKDVVKADGVVLFVGTRAEHRSVVRRAVEKLEGNGFGVAGTSWMAGTLTNSIS